MAITSDQFGLAIVHGHRHVGGPLRRAYVAELWATAKQNVAALKCEGLLDQAIQMLPEYFDEVAADNIFNMPYEEVAIRRYRLLALALTCLHTCCLRQGSDIDELFSSNGLLIEIGDGVVHGVIVDGEPESIDHAARMMAFRHPTRPTGTLH